MGKFFYSFILTNGIFLYSSFGQNPDKIDSLVHKLGTAVGSDKAVLLNHLGREYLYIDLQKSKEYLDKALDMAQNEKWDEIMAVSYQNLGAFYLSAGHYDSAIDAYNHAVTFYETKGGALNLARINQEKGILHFRKGEYSDALVIYKKALSSYQNLEYTIGVCAILSSIGDVYRYLGDYPTALEYYLRGLKIAEALDDIPRKAGLLNGLGLIAIKQKDYDNALEYFQQGLVLAEALGFEVYMASFVHNIADVYSNKGDYGKALKFHLKSLEIEQKQQNLDGQALSLTSIGIMYESMGENLKAIESFKASLAIADSIGAARSVAMNCNNLSRLYRKEGQIQTSLAYAQRAFDSAMKQGFREQIYSSHLNLAKSYAAMNEYKKAYTNYTVYSSLKDSVFNKTKTAQIAEMQIKYETEQKEQEIANLQVEASNEAFKRNAYALGLFSTFIMAGLIIAWLNATVKKSKKIREHENLLVTEKFRAYETELNRFTQHALEKNQHIELLNEELEKMREGIPGDCPQYTIHLDKLMQSTILTGKEWDEFKILFEKVHPGFFINLRTKYPDLSTSEIRMAALVKLNLTSTEISGMLGISHESVNKSRYRLRKKLNLLKEEKLETYLKDL